MILRLVVVLILLTAGGVAAYRYWDAIVPQSPHASALRGRPTVLENRRVPGFALPGLIGEGFAARDLINAKRPVVVKFWGSWTPATILEQPILLDLQQQRVPIWGIVFRDTRTKALDYLERNGNPYTRIALDESGKTGLDWGVTEVPATFVVDGEGIVRWFHTGPLTTQIVNSQLLPVLDRHTP